MLPRFFVAVCTTAMLCSTGGFAQQEGGLYGGLLFEEAQFAKIKSEPLYRPQYPPDSTYLYHRGDNPEPVRRTDWLHFLTNALYYKWEAESKGKRTGGNAMIIRREFGAPAESNTAWRSGTNSVNAGKCLFLGPAYTQYLRYFYTNKPEYRALTRYIASFRIKLAKPIGDSIPVCRLIARAFVNGKERILKDRIITSDELSALEYREANLHYDYRSLGFDSSTAPSAMLNPYQISSPEIKARLELQWLGAGDILLDCVEVYDEHIWRMWFSDHWLITGIHIRDYCSRIQTQPKKKAYYAFFDQPFAIERIEPLRRVQRIIDSLDIPLQLAVRFTFEKGNEPVLHEVLGNTLRIRGKSRGSFWYEPGKEKGVRDDK